MEDRIKNSRNNFEKLGSHYERADNIISEKTIIENVNCYWFNKTGLNGDNKIIIYLHGGCFVLGSIHSHQALVSHLADNLNIPILFIEYSLAPESPFPAAVDDILKVFKAISLVNQTRETIFMGDSAGAGLAVSVISILSKKKIATPKRLVMISPWVDLSQSNDSITGNAQIDPILTKDQLQWFTFLYLGKSVISEANPIQMMSGKFPPTLILVGSSEILLDDSKMAYSAILQGQPATKLKIYDHQTHVWLLDDIHSASSRDAIEEIRIFITEN